MTSELVAVTFYKIMQSRSYTAILLGTQEKQFAIYVEPSVGKQIQTHLTRSKKPRPPTHLLLHSMCTGFGITLLQVVLNDLEDTTYYARMFLEQSCGETKTILEIDARPSDCITLALMSNAPVYCKREVFERALAVEG